MPTQDDFLVFGKPYIGEEEFLEVQDSLRKGWIGCGPKTKKFEENFAAYRGCASAVALNSGTAALFHALDAEGIGAGDEVITTAMTFVATVNAVLHVGGMPVLVDIDEDTHNIDPSKIEAAITPRTKAIIPVHIAGLPCDMTAIMDIAQRHGLVVIEDAAHAIEAEIDGKKIGAIGDYGCFSFYPTKNLTTAEGGMLLAKDPEKLDRVRRRSAHGLSADAYSRYTSSTFLHYRATDMGFKNNMNDLQAALGIHQLARIDTNWKRREEISEFYHRELQGLNLIMPAAPEKNQRHAHHLFALRVTEGFGISRDEMIVELKARGIGCGVHFLAISQHPYHADKLGLSPDDYPIAERVASQTLSIPLAANLSDADIERVVAAVKDIHAAF